MLLSPSPDCSRVIEVIELEKIQRKVVKMLRGVEKLSHISHKRAKSQARKAGL